MQKLLVGQKQNTKDTREELVAFREGDTQRGKQTRTYSRGTITPQDDEDFVGAKKKMALGRSRRKALPETGTTVLFGVSATQPLCCPRTELLEP